jgi:hypothetical protein
MKTRLFSLIMILMVSASLTVAQNKTSFAVLGGVNFQNLNGKYSNGNKLTNDMLLGFHAGINIQLPLAPEIYFQPGLTYAVKGAKISTVKYKLSYVELPLNVVYKALLGSGYFMLGFGPYVAYGIGGKVVPESGTTSKITFKKSMESGDVDFTVYKPFDAGGNILVGYEMAGGIFLQLDTQLGMLNIYPENSSGSNDISTMKNTGFGFSLGYRF